VSERGEQGHRQHSTGHHRSVDAVGCMSDGCEARPVGGACMMMLNSCRPGTADIFGPGGRAADWPPYVTSTVTIILCGCLTGTKVDTTGASSLPFKVLGQALLIPYAISMLHTAILVTSDSQYERANFRPVCDI